MIMIASIFPPCHADNRWECVIIIFPPSDCDDDENNSRYLQTLHSISAEKNSTIIFPLPMELLGGFIDTQVINDWSCFFVHFIIPSWNFQPSLYWPAFVTTLMFSGPKKARQCKRCGRLRERSFSHISSPCSSQDQEEQKRTQPTNCEGWDFFKSKCFFHCPNMPTYTCDGLDNIFMGVTNLN